MFVGEAPGASEAQEGKPFVGKSGQELESYLRPHGLSLHQFYRTNVSKSYIESNPDPSPDLIASWSPVLITELSTVKPSIIICVGKHSTQWFLGLDAELETCHGLPHHVGAFDPSNTCIDRVAQSGLDPSTLIILPCYHPAAAFYRSTTRTGLDIRTLLAWDYAQAAQCINLLRSHKPIYIRPTPDTGTYIDVCGEEMADLLSDAAPHIDYIGYDTEGIPEIPLSLQLSYDHATALVLRVTQPDLALGIRSVQSLINAGKLFIMHQADTPRGCCYDFQVSRTMGLEFNIPQSLIWDTMYAAYLTRVESRGLKALTYRRLGFKMVGYEELLLGRAKDKQITYLTHALSLSRLWNPKPAPHTERLNDGTYKTTKPKSITSRIKSILHDISINKVNKDDEPVNPHTRWYDILPYIRGEVEAELGPLPEASLYIDLPLQDAINYAGADADFTRRLYPDLSTELSRLGLSTRMSLDMHNLKINEKMQSRGMIASRVHFQSLFDRLDSEANTIQSKISATYLGGRPFNPKSHLQTSKAMEELGIYGSELTKSGKVSSSQKSIQHLKDESEFVSDLFEWRERAHNRDMFCAQVLELIPESEDLYPIHTNLKTTRTTTRRLASFKPNWLATPSRTELGRLIRSGYQAREGMIFTSHDLSQIEARCLAHESRDPLLLKFFINGDDIHIHTAAFLNGVRVEDVTTEQRRAAKTINYGIIYGIGPPGLMGQLRMLKPPIIWSEDRCEEVLREWFKIYPGVAEYSRVVVQEARRVGYVRDYSGMYRYLPGLMSRDNRVRSESERFAVSQRIQGLAQTMIQNSERWLDENLFQPAQESGVGIYWILQIHDELMTEIDDNDETWEYVDEMMIEGLTQHCGIRLRVPVLADGHRAKTWGELKG